MTRRVRRRVAEHAEAHQLMALETDTAPFEVTTDKVRSRRKAVEQAAALWRLDRDPRVLAYRDARVRRLVLAVALVSLTLRAGVVDGRGAGVRGRGRRGGEPAVVVRVAGRAVLLAGAADGGGRPRYLTTRGQPLHDRAVDRTEWVFLGLTLGMNAWPHLPGVAAGFTVSGLVLHLLGPVVAVAVVRCLPRLLAAFAGLALPTGPVDGGPGRCEGGGQDRGRHPRAYASPARPQLTHPGDTRRAPTRPPRPPGRAARRRRAARGAGVVPEPKRRSSRSWPRSSPPRSPTRRPGSTRPTPNRSARR